MRSLIVKILATMTSFYVAQYLVEGFSIESNWQAYLIAAIVFMLFNLLVSPLIKLLLLPINLLTLGLFRWLTNVLILYIFDILYVGITIMPYRFGGYTSAILSLPAANLSMFWVLVASSLAISFAYSLVVSLLQGEE